MPEDLTLHLGPAVPKKLLDPLVQKAIRLNDREFTDLVAFIRNGLLDARVNAANLCQLVPAGVPSGLPVMNFEACP